MNSRKHKKQESSDEWSSEEEDQMIDFANKHQDMDVEDDQIEFEFYDSHENQYHSIKNLINNLLDGNQYNSSELADIITKQVELGTMVGVAEQDSHLLKDKEILGFSTILNITKRTETSLKQVQQFITSKLRKNGSLIKKINEVVDQGEQVGLLINERLINLSPQIVPELFNQLKQDIVWAQQEEEYKDSHKYKYIVYMTNCYKEQQTDKKMKLGPLQQYLYSKFEDYVFLEKALDYEMFGAGSKQNSGLTIQDECSQQQVFKVVMLMEFKQFGASIDRIKDYLEL